MLNKEPKSKKKLGFDGQMNEQNKHILIYYMNYNKTFFFLLIILFNKFVDFSSRSFCFIFNFN